MGKQDRYNFDGADDSFDTDTSDQSTEPATSNTDDTSANRLDTDENQAAAIPHRIRFDSPKDRRKAKTFYLDTDEDLTRLQELQSLAEREFEETVHRLDVYLAAFRSDLSDERFLEEMRRIGYGYFD